MVWIIMIIVLLIAWGSLFAMRSFNSHRVISKRKIDEEPEFELISKENFQSFYKKIEDLHLAEKFDNLFHKKATSKEIILIGDAHEKSTFLNAFLGIPFFTEQNKVNLLPIVCINANSPTGLFVKSKNEKNNASISNVNEISKDWRSFDYVEVSLTDHPILAQGLSLWDTPGSINNKFFYIDYILEFLKKKRRCKYIYYFVKENLSPNDISLLNELKEYHNKITIIVTVNNNKSYSEIKRIEGDIKKKVNFDIPNVNTEVLYLGEKFVVFDENLKSKRNELSESQLLKNYSVINMNFQEYLLENSNNIIGNIIYENIKELAKEKEIETHDKNIIENTSNKLQQKSQNESSTNTSTENKSEIDIEMKRAVDWYRSLAEQGDREAQYNLGRCYENGVGVEKNMKLAAEWWKKAADLGMPEAQYDLAICYKNGFGIEQSLEKTVEYYAKAAIQGLVDAQYNLGLCYAKGLGISKDMKKAVEWWTKAADQNDNLALYNLGVCYENGVGVEQNRAKATEMWLKSAKAGNENAKKMLASAK